MASGVDACAESLTNEIFTGGDLGGKLDGTLVDALEGILVKDE